MARVVSGYVDVVMARVFEHQHVVELAKWADIPVINGLSDYNHPCQAAADALTIQENFGNLKDLNVTYVGDGNNVAVSLMHICAKLGADFTIANPEDRLGGGALVRATLSLDQQFTSLAVSKDAIVRQGPQTLVYTIQDGQAAPLPVMITSEQETMVAIAGQGITNGMTVVVRGNERLRDGQTVRVVPFCGGF